MRRTRKALMIGTTVAVLSLAVAVPAFAATTATPAAPGWAGAICRGTTAVSKAVSDLLGMQPTDIAAQRQAGKSLAQIAKAKNVSQDKLVATILAAKKAALDQAVKNGRLTQAQADAMIEQMKNRVSDRVDDTTVGPRGAGRGMMGGGGQGLRAGACLGTEVAGTGAGAQPGL